MWEDSLNALGAKFSEHVQIESIDENKTGLIDTDIKTSIDKTPEGALCVLLLPLAHSALNLQDSHLSIIGPAVATRNDIFLFRDVNKTPKLEESRDCFHIAVKENDITTSNALRIILTKWSFDMVFYADLSGLDDYEDLQIATAVVRRHMRRGIFQYEEHATAEERVARILEPDGCDAGIFMGEDLVADGVSLFEHEGLIDAMNINREINNIYNTREFPRAVFCVAGEHVKNTKAIDRFCEIYNSTVVDIIRPNYDEHKVQMLLLTGPKSEPRHVNTLIAFTRDMETNAVKALRRRHAGPTGPKDELSRSAALSRANFIYRREIFFSEYKRLVREELVRYCTEGLAAEFRNVVTNFDRKLDSEPGLLDRFCEGRTFNRAARAQDALVASTLKDKGKGILEAATARLEASGDGKSPGPG